MQERTKRVRGAGRQWQGTSVHRYVPGEEEGALLRQSKSVPRPAAWGVRGKPNELKRLDVPVSDPTSRAAARHQKRKCNSSRRQPVHFVQGWSIFCLLSITSEQQAVSSSAVSAVSAATAVVKQHHKDPHQNSTSNLPSQHIYLLTRSTVKDISICLHCIVLHLHCVALCRSRLPVGQSRRLYFSDRYTLGAHLFYHSLPFPPPQSVSPPHISPSTQSPVVILLPLFSLLLPLSPSHFLSLSTSLLSLSHFLVLTQTIPASRYSILGDNSRISKSCLLMRAIIPELPTIEGRIELDCISAHPYPDPPCNTPVFL